MEANEKKNIEDEAVKTDLHELVCEEVSSNMNAYAILNASEHRQTRLEVQELKNLVVRLSPGRTWVIVNNIGKWAAIIILFILVLNQCTISDTRKNNDHESTYSKIENINH